MLTLLRPEAHEVTSAVIVPENDGFKLVVNKGQDQTILRRKEAVYCKDAFRVEFAVTKCQWSGENKRPKKVSFRKQYYRIKQLEKMIDRHLKLISEFENEIKQIKKGL